MKAKDGFQPCDNAQAGVETTARLIVGPRVSQVPNDKRELIPDAAAVAAHVLANALLVDSGFVSAAAASAPPSARPESARRQRRGYRPARANILWVRPMPATPS